MPELDVAEGVAVRAAPEVYFDALGEFLDGEAVGEAQFADGDLRTGSKGCRGHDDRLTTDSDRMQASGRKIPPDCRRPAERQTCKSNFWRHSGVRSVKVLLDLSKVLRQSEGVPEPDWENLAEAVHHQRILLRMSQTDLQPRGGPSATLVRQIEKGVARGISARTKTTLEDVLGWDRGVVDDLLAGAVTPRLRPVPDLSWGRGGAPDVEYDEPSLDELIAEADRAAEESRRASERLHRRLKRESEYQRRTAAQDAAGEEDQFL